MKNNKGFASLAIVLIIIAVLAVGGVAYYAGKSATPAPQNTAENNYQPPVNQNNTTNTFFSILSPKEGDQWVAGQTYSISLKEGIDSDYHPLTQVFAVLDSQGKGVGVICPDNEMQKGARTFEWKAGTLMTACSGTGNSEIKMPQGKYQILFTEFNSNGDKIRTEKSGIFNLY